MVLPLSTVIHVNTVNLGRELRTLPDLLVETGRSSFLCLDCSLAALSLPPSFQIPQV